MTMVRNSLLSDNVVQSIFFHAGHEVNTLGGPSTKEGIVIITPIIHDNRSRVKLKQIGGLDIRNLSFRDEGKPRKITFVIQKQMEFNRPLGAAEMSPVIHLQTQINDGRIHADQPILESEPFLSDGLNPTSLKELEEDLLIEFPGTVSIGIGQARMAGSSDPEVFQLAFATPKTPGNLPEGMSAAQLTEEHSDKLTPTGESFGMTFGMNLFHHLLKFDSRKQL
jgi:hypothetical protein